MAWLARSAPHEAAWLDGAGWGGGWLGAHADETYAGEDPALLDEVEARWRADPTRIWIGWLTYDWGAARHGVIPPTAVRLPGIGFRRYAGAVELGRVPRLHGDPRACRSLWRDLGQARVPVVPRWPWTPLVPHLPPATYRGQVERVREFIRSGDTYQVNLSQSFAARAPTEASWPDCVAAYAELRRRSPAAMGGILRIGSQWVLSNSPETLLEVRCDPQRHRACSWPIKGTRPRGADDAADHLAAQALLASAKDAAEHVMIVDLVRNDLGRVARPGTVRADTVPSLVSLASVHHLVTPVRAESDPDVSLRRWIDALFPGGSITGAPKRRTMRIIADLERACRGIYCGGLIVLEPAGWRINIAIRTATVGGHDLEVRGGGGVVIDSEPEAERLETLAKVAAFQGPA